MPPTAPPVQDAARLGAPTALQPNQDPVAARPPRQRAYGQWLLTRMSDIRAVLADPTTTVDLLMPKAISRAVDQQGVPAEALMAIMRIVDRAHRTPNDTERLNAIAVTKRFHAAFPALDLRAPLTALTDSGETTADAMSAVLRPILMEWRAAALGVDARLGQRVEDSLLSLMMAVERVGITSVAAQEPQAAQILRDLEDLSSTRRHAREMPVMHWISPAFLAIMPVGYTSVSMMAHLAENPELQDRLRAHPDLRPGYLREVERMMNSFRYTVRQIGPAGLDLGDVRLPPRSLVVLDLVSANRDPSIWEDPDECRLDRPRLPTATSSFGPLACTGTQLSRQFLAGLLDAVLHTVRLSLPAPGDGPDRRATDWSISRGYTLCRLRFAPVR